MMEVGWFVYPWLSCEDASRRLFKNLADTLVEPFMAAGLAARCHNDMDAFWTSANAFTPPNDFGEQYRDGLQFVENHGIEDAQAVFWRIESECRKAIELASLGIRVPGDT